MSRTYKWQFHFNAVHNITPESEKGKHPHSFLIILWMKIIELDLEKLNDCENELKNYLEQYNGRFLNEMEQFRGKIPTIETICEALYYDTERIAASYGLEQIQMEVGDSPVALFALGKKMLLGGTYHVVTDEEYQTAKQQIGLVCGKTEE